MELLFILAFTFGLILLVALPALIWTLNSRRAASSLPFPITERLKPQIEMIGREAVVVSPVGQGFRGTVKLEGELWLARLVAEDGKGYPAELESGARVRVVDQQDLLLLVEPLPVNAPQGWHNLLHPENNEGRNGRI